MQLVVAAYRTTLDTVVRVVSGADRTDDELFKELMDQVQDWQGTVTDLALEYAAGETDIAERLR